MVYQFFQTTIWSEPLQQHKAYLYNSFSSRYRFNAKERDWETGSFYYGARYYDPKISVWLSVIPLAHEFPGWSPYNFTMNNPLNLVDPDGMSATCPTCPDGQEYDEYRDSNIDYEYCKNEDGGGEIHVSSSQTMEEVTVTSTSAFIPNIRFKEEIVDIIRNSAFMDSEGEIPNPCYQAEAIYIDRGISFIGSKGDLGVYIVLVGEDKGRIYPYGETAVGPGTDLGIEVEVGRVDFSGDPADFRGWHLYGARYKTYIGDGGIGFGASVARSRSYLESGEYITTWGFQFGVGMSPFLISGGYNEGEVSISR